MARGTITAAIRFQQKCSFEGMVWGTISPTDIDCAIDFQDRLQVFIEAKSGDAPLGTGQRLQLERLCRQPVGRHAVAIVARHDTPPDEHIILADCQVERVYSSGRWKVVDGRISVMDQIDLLLDEYGLDFASAHRVSHVSRPKPTPEAVKVQASVSGCIHLERFKDNGRCFICERTKR